MRVGVSVPNSGRARLQLLLSIARSRHTSFTSFSERPHRSLTSHRDHDSAINHRPVIISDRLVIATQYFSWPSVRTFTSRRHRSPSYQHEHPVSRQPVQIHAWFSLKLLSPDGNRFAWPALQPRVHTSFVLGRVGTEFTANSQLESLPFEETSTPPVVFPSSIERDQPSLWRVFRCFPSSIDCLHPISLEMDDHNDLPDMDYTSLEINGSSLQQSKCGTARRSSKPLPSYRTNTAARPIAIST